VTAFGALPLDVPVDPDAPEARRWLIEELSKEKYHPPAETPSWLRDWLRSIQEWFDSLFDGVSSPGGSPVWLVVLLVIAAAVLVVAFLIFGVPRLNRRSRERGELFGEDDERDSAALRRAALRAAAAGDFATAIAELFRALARNLSERTIVTTSPGTTAHGFVREAAAAFPDAAVRLADAADDFDRVRYLGAPGTAEQWTSISALEKELRSAKPVRDDDRVSAVMW
jgi:HAMP domain-containing protein